MWESGNELEILGKREGLVSVDDERMRRKGETYFNVDHVPSWIVGFRFRIIVTVSGTREAEVSEVTPFLDPSFYSRMFWIPSIMIWVTLFDDFCDSCHSRYFRV